MMMSVDHIRSAVGILGNILSFVLFISPMPTFCRILTNKSVEEFHPYPYLAGVMNCLMWIYYTLPFVDPQSAFVIQVNRFGLFLHLYYLAIFFCHTGRRYRLEIVGIFLGEIVGVATIIAGTKLGLHTFESRWKVVGILANFFVICMYASPLSIMPKVIKTKSAEFFPKLLSIAGFLNGICWTIYALLKFDPYILVGNGVGTLLSLVQLVLLVIYLNPPKEDEKPSTVDLPHPQLPTD